MTEIPPYLFTALIILFFAIPAWKNERMRRAMTPEERKRFDEENQAENGMW